MNRGTPMSNSEARKAAQERATEGDSLVRALRFAQARAVTERARGRADEERDWLDMCALLEARNG